MKVGDYVRCNGQPGRVKEICRGQLKGMAVVQLHSGAVCVDVEDVKPETYTKGPWRYEEGTKTIRAVPSNYWLASMDSFDGAVNHEANARAIAAVPDLIEALEAIQHNAEVMHQAEPNAVWSGVADMCREALGKAGIA